MKRVIVSTKVENFRAFLDETDYVGTVEVTLPDIEGITDTIKGAGINGEIDDAGTQLKSMKTKFSFTATNQLTSKLYAPKVHRLDLRAAVRDFNPSTGSFADTGRRYVMKLKPIKGTGGKVAPGEKMGNEMEFEVLYYKEIIDGKTMVEIDKLNNKFVVDGFDYLAAQRRIFGD